MRGSPLGDLRILAVEQYGAGPWGTLQLADLGAEVIKVEDPSVGGDVGRYVPPYQVGESSLFFESFNRNKLSVSLDLRHPDSRAVLEDLVKASDAVFSNLRGDQPDKLRLRYRDLEPVNPRVVCCSLSGFGMDGPRSREGAYDFTIQGLAGWQSLTGGPDDPPTKSGLSLVDFSGGYVAALAICAGVWAARRDGHGGDLDLSLFETALSELNYLATWVASRGYEPVRRRDSAHQTMVPFQNFQTEDGWIVVACPKQHLWEELCRAAGQESLLRDDRFTTFELRNRHRDELLAVLEPVFRSKTTELWLKELSSHRVPCAPINSVAGALDDAQAKARDGVIEFEHPVLGVVRQPATPFRFQDVTPPTRRAPFLGEDTERVLSGVCGYEPAIIEDLRRRGVFGEDHGVSEALA